MEADYASIDSFFANDQTNLETIRDQLPHFAKIVRPLHRLYDLTLKLIHPSAPIVFGRCLLLCHKSFLSAAAMIARRHPDDAGPITRRAIEIAAVALAVKHDRSNLGRWQSHETRLARWRDRAEGKKPKHLQTQIRYPERHAVLESIRGYEGVLSDAFVHFTPEFAETQGWRMKAVGDGGHLELLYLEGDQRVIEREFVVLGGVHARIIDLFDECYDYAFSHSDEWRSHREDIARREAALGRLFAEAPAPSEEEEE